MLHNLSSMVSVMSELDPLYYQFIKDQQADNFFFCFRWFLTFFKREFSHMNTVIYLWEVLWSHHDKDYQYYFALAMLESVRADIMALSSFDEILKKINDFSDKFDAENVLALSQGIYAFKHQVLMNCE